MNEVLSFLWSIPVVFWASVGGATLAVIGALISNRDNTKRLIRQLEHDAKQRELDRTLSLRREVYLRTAEELVKVSTYLGSLSQLDLSKAENLSGLSGFQTEAAKLQLVAEPKTALLVNNLSFAYAELQLRLFTHLLPLQVVSHDLALVDDYAKRDQAEHARVLSEMSRLTESGQPNTAVSSALIHSLESAQKRVDDRLLEREPLHQRLQNLRYEFMGQLVMELKEIGPLHIPVLIAFRRDLGFSADHLAELTDQMERGWNRAIPLLDSMVRTLKDLEMDSAG